MYQSHNRVATKFKITESGVHPLYQNCHHQIIYAKFNLQIYSQIIDRSGIAMMQILNLLDVQLISLI